MSFLQDPRFRSGIENEKRRQAGQPIVPYTGPTNEQLQPELVGRQGQQAAQPIAAGPRQQPSGANPSLIGGARPSMNRRSLIGGYSR